MTSPHLIIDDHLLLRILLHDEPPELRPRGGRVSTTGLWYHRLARALTIPILTGALSRSLGGAGFELGAAALQAVTVLPDTIGLTSLRDLAWPMAQLLGTGVRLNLLSLEALAAAQVLGGEICLAQADENPPLVRCCRARCFGTTGGAVGGKVAAG